MSFYDNTKEDIRPWRADQDTRAGAADTAAQANATALATSTTKYARNSGVVVTPGTATIAVAGTTTPTSVVESGVLNKGVTWSSSAPSKATVNASTGLVTGVASGTARIKATSVENPRKTGYIDITVS